MTCVEQVVAGTVWYFKVVPQTELSIRGSTIVKDEDPIWIKAHTDMHMHTHTSIVATTAVHVVGARAFGTASMETQAVVADMVCFVALQVFEQPWTNTLQVCTQRVRGGDY